MRHWNSCSRFNHSVIPIMGRSVDDRGVTSKEFIETAFKTGQIGYHVYVSRFKDRLIPVLKREWDAAISGTQQRYHFNCPDDMKRNELMELAAEYKKKKINPKTGRTTYFWYRPSNRRNENARFVDIRARGSGNSSS